MLPATPQLLSLGGVVHGRATVGAVPVRFVEHGGIGRRAVCNPSNARMAQLAACNPLIACGPGCDTCICWGMFGACLAHVWGMFGAARRADAAWLVPKALSFY